MHIVSQITSDQAPTHSLALSYEDRFIRRKKLTTDQGEVVTVDLSHAIRFADGDQLSDGSVVLEIRAAPEPLIEVRGDITRLAWHIGNRHTACQIERDRLLVVAEPVLEKMLRGLGGQLTHIMAPFQPEKGAYHKHDH